MCLAWHRVQDKSVRDDNDANDRKEDKNGQKGRVRPGLVLKWDTVFPKKDCWVYHSIKQVFAKCLAHAGPDPWNCNVKAGIGHDIELFESEPSLPASQRIELGHQNISEWNLRRWIFCGCPQSRLHTSEPEVKGRGYSQYPFTVPASYLSPSPPRNKHAVYPQTRITPALNSAPHPWSQPETEQVYGPCPLPCPQPAFFSVEKHFSQRIRLIREVRKRRNKEQSKETA